MQEGRESEKEEMSCIEQESDAKRRNKRRKRKLKSVDTQQERSA